MAGIKFKQGTDSVLPNPMAGGKKPPLESFSTVIRYNQLRKALEDGFSDEVGAEIVKNPGLVATIASLRSDSSSAVCWNAAKALRYACDHGVDIQPAFPALARALGDGNDLVRRHASEALIQAIKKGASIEPVIRIIEVKLKHINSEVRLAAVDLLEQAAQNRNDISEVYPAIFETMASPNTKLQKKAAMTLIVASQDAGSREKLIAFLSTKEGPQNFKAMRSILEALFISSNEIDISPFIGLTIRALCQPDQRGFASNILKKAILNPRNRECVASALVDNILDPNPDIWRSAIEFLTQAADKGDPETRISMLRHFNSFFTSNRFLSEAERNSVQYVDVMEVLVPFFETIRVSWSQTVMAPESQVKGGV